MTLIEASRDDLLTTLPAVLGIVERRHALPILGHGLLRKRGAMLTLTTSDLEYLATMQSALGNAQGDADTSGAAHKLANTLRALPPGQMLTMTPARHHLTLRSGRSRCTLQTMQTLPAENYSAVRPADDGVNLRLPQAQLCTLLNRVAFAMAAHDIRHHLNGVLISAAGRRLTAVATDGNRLAVAHVTLDAYAPPFSVILPRKTVHELQRLLRPQGDSAGGSRRRSAGALRH